MSHCVVRLVLVLAIASSVGTVCVAETTEPNLRRSPVVNVVEKTKDAVVNISTTKIVSKRVSPFGNDPFFGSLDIGNIVRMPANSLGSGFIVHPEGYVVTNHHVIDRARTIVVELSDGRKLPAELISSEQDNDLAILKIKSDKPLPVLELGDSADLMIGEPLVAVGNPLGFSHSVSTGIVSAVHRDLKGQDNRVMLGDLIQTDAAINPGNSGGPLLNMYGQVIGINTAIRGDAQNIGFAIPINRLRDQIPQLMKPSVVNHVQLPVVLEERRTTTPPAQVAVSLFIKGEKSPIASINGRAPRDIVDAHAILVSLKPESKVDFKLQDGKALQYVLTPAPKPDAIVNARKRLGLTIEPVTPAISQRFGLRTEDGMLITEVDAKSIAQRAGLQPGDVIVRIEQYPCSNLEQFGILLHALPESGKIRVTVVRGDQVGAAVLDL